MAGDATKGIIKPTAAEQRDSTGGSLKANNGPSPTLREVKFGVESLLKRAADDLDKAARVKS